jgi:DNA invertase Pin-like site-specific DNA recombinase
VAAAALYLRSSKDRSDVSIDAQRRALTELADARGLCVQSEFADAVESGKDEDRPGFQRLLAALRDGGRGWSTILVHDTSRVARRRHISFFFEDACRKAGVTVVYKNMPESDPVTDTLLRAIMQALDEWHSLTSKQKGLSGMAENVRQGYRAGGRAPTGYRLKKLMTGAVRDGSPVTKTVLELDPELAPKVQAYLRARAAGMQGKIAADHVGLEVSPSSRVGMEWNALQYAGHTVWNVNAEREGGGYVGGSKRQPRSEWIIQRDTHPALIKEEEAEALLKRLEGLGGRSTGTSRARGRTLLSGLLVSPTGDSWRSEGLEYRLRSARRSVKAKTLEESVLEQVRAELIDGTAAKRLVADLQAERAADLDPQERDRLLHSKAVLQKRIRIQMELAGQMANPKPALQLAEELDRECSQVTAQLAEMDRVLAQPQPHEPQLEKAAQESLRSIMEKRRGDPRGLLIDVVEKVELDPKNLSRIVRYRMLRCFGPY